MKHKNYRSKRSLGSGSEVGEKGKKKKGTKQQKRNFGGEHCQLSGGPDYLSARFAHRILFLLRSLVPGSAKRQQKVLTTQQLTEGPM